jgi:hypothetical protein
MARVGVEAGVLHEMNAPRRKYGSFQNEFKTHRSGFNI